LLLLDSLLLRLCSLPRLQLLLVLLLLLLLVWWASMLGLLPCLLQLLGRPHIPLLLFPLLLFQMLVASLAHPMWRLSPFEDKRPSCLLGCLLLLRPRPTPLVTPSTQNTLLLLLPKAATIKAGVSTLGSLAVLACGTV